MFNTKQVEVIEEINENILLLASAGTGKTNTLAARISNILDKNLALPEEILCITFTNKACNEMKQRISQSISNGKDVNIKTFHSLCFDIIKKQAKKRTDIDSNFIIYDEEDSLAVIRDTFSSRMESKTIKGIIDLIKSQRLENGIFSQNEMSDLQNTVNYILNNKPLLEGFISSHKKYKDSVENVIRENGSKLVIVYNKALKRYGALDFIDLQTIVYDLFQDQRIVDDVSYKFKYINIDEIQDTSITEYKIVEKMFESSKSNILLCGDIFQTIYEWRGSNPSEIINLYKEKYNPKQVVFNENYRATKFLTECATDYLTNAFPEESRNMFSDSIKSNSTEMGEKLVLHQAQNEFKEAQWIIQEILKLDEEKRKKVCILTRDNKYNIGLSDSLRRIANGRIGFALIDDTKFFRKTEVKDIVAFLKLISNQNDGTALKRILRRVSRYGINDNIINTIDSTEFRRSGVYITDFINKTALANKDKFALLEKELTDNNIIVFDVESTGIDTTRDEIIQIAAIRIDSEGKELERFMRFLKPSKSVGTSADVHGFSDEFLNKNGEDKELVLREFLDFIDGRTIVGHNVQYDINILNSELARNNLPKANFKDFFDTLDLYRRFYPNLPNHKLGSLSEMIDTEHKPNHNALYDILATGEILVDIVEAKVKPTATIRRRYMELYIDIFKDVAEDINNLISYAVDKRPYDIIQYVVKTFNLLDIFANNSIEAANMREFYFTAKAYDDSSLCNKDALMDIIKMTSLSDGQIEKLYVEKNKIPIITIHQSKGLEFDYVFLAGLQNYVLPNFHAMINSSFEEEKRVMYVGITRARKKLFMSYSKVRNSKYQQKSMFLNLINDRFIDVI